MKSLVVLGNWKANKTRDEARAWIESFASEKIAVKAGLTVIVCPAFHHLDLFLEARLPIGLGVQDLSMYPIGAYTGEVAASMVAGIVKYALLGHSERRKYFGETNESIAKKVQQALRQGITPIVCVSQLSEAISVSQSEFVKQGMLLYEPLFAIGSGQADTPQNANAFAQEVARHVGPVPVLYGGSVKPENAAGFYDMEYLRGVGVGGASLDPRQFIQLIKVAWAKT